MPHTLHYRPVATTLPASSGKAVALDAVLAARDARVARQQAMLAQGGVLLSLTLVAPGAVKRSPLLDTIFAAALDALRPHMGDARARQEAVDDGGHHASLRWKTARRWRGCGTSTSSAATATPFRAVTSACRRAVASSATTTPKPAPANVATASMSCKRTSPAATACTNKRKR